MVCLGQGGDLSFLQIAGGRSLQIIKSIHPTLFAAIIILIVVPLIAFLYSSAVAPSRRAVNEIVSAEAYRALIDCLDASGQVVLALEVRLHANSIRSDTYRFRGPSK